MPIFLVRICYARFILFTEKIIGFIYVFLDILNHLPRNLLFFLPLMTQLTLPLYDSRLQFAQLALY
jgi:hypothetical protein